MTDQTAPIKTYQITIEGQTIPVPPEIGSSDAAVKAALAPYFPDAANAMITRSEKGDVVTVNVVKKAGSKGLSPLPPCLPRTWDTWDETLGEYDSVDPDTWSLPVYFYMIETGGFGPDTYAVAEHFGWPEDAVQIRRGVFDSAEFCRRLEAHGLGDFAHAYRCVWAATGNIFIDYDNGESGEFELPVLSLANVREFEAQYVSAQVILERFTAAVTRANEDPAVFSELTRHYNASLRRAARQSRRPRTLVEVFA